ncbi:hypothetical protein N7465_003572 [Penicillium sp. CMV-2018d]|nr:hypothetical protein N7465_003572 [Penicillium sp. CMV-2018d]
MTTDTQEVLSDELAHLRISGGASGVDEGLTTLDEFVKTTFQPTLHNQINLEPIVPTHSFFDRAKELHQKHEWPEERFENFQRLLCGTRNFPCILLLNPKNDLLPFDEMVKATPTLTWLENTLEEIGLRLDDVIIMDLFPMLTDEWLEEHPDKRDQVIPEMFGLTLDFIREFKLPIILSCQCFRPFQHERWGSFNHEMISKLSSSMVSAECQTVFGFHFEEHFIQRGRVEPSNFGFYFEEHFIHCVRGFHPAILDYVDDEREHTSLDKNLRQIFHSLFEPCAHWQNENLEKTLHGTRMSIQILIERLRQSAAEYDQLRMRGHPPGMSQHREDLITAEQWDNTEKALNLIVQLLPPNTSKKSPW